MINTKKGSKLAVLAAILYIFLLLFEVFDYGINTIVTVWYFPKAADLIYWFLLIGLAVTLFTKNKIAVICTVSLLLLLHVYYLLVGFSVGDLTAIMAYMMILVLLILALIGTRAVAYLWYIPWVLMLIGVLIRSIYFLQWLTYYLRDAYYPDFIYFYYLARSIMSLYVSALLEILALIFFGLWLKASVSAPKAPRTIPYAPQQPNAYAPQPNAYVPQPDAYVPQQPNAYAQQPNAYAQQPNAYAQQPNAYVPQQPSYPQNAYAPSQPQNVPPYPQNAYMPDRPNVEGPNQPGAFVPTPQNAAPPAQAIPYAQEQPNVSVPDQSAPFGE